jgi:hypothetical protein
MYFTLNGTSTASGYPTFLIIFERLKAKPKKGKRTVVHFHRVRPCRSKDRVIVPGNELIKACYAYMAGNIQASEIVAQQGDLMLRAVDKPKDVVLRQNGEKITFESHTFVGPLSMYPGASKKQGNRLGYVHAPTGLQLTHPEHEDTDRLPGGWYEVLRAKSYENNPTGIWSLTID